MDPMVADAKNEWCCIAWTLKRLWLETEHWNELLLWLTGKTGSWTLEFGGRICRPAFLAAFGKNWPIWFLPRGDTLYQVDLVHQALWFMARKKGEVGVLASSGRWLSKILKYRTGHCSVLVANIFGLNWRWCEPSNPWRVFPLFLPAKARFLCLFQDQFEAPNRPSTISGFRPWLWIRSGVKRTTIMCAGALRHYGNQKRHSQTTFPLLRLSIHGKRLACFHDLTSQYFFFWRPIPLWNDKTLRL